MATAHEDAIDSLLGQHNEIRLLFAQVETATGEHREALFTELIALLAVHESIEQAFVHPLAQRTIDDGDQVATVHVAEEQDAREALSRLYELGPGAAEFPIALAAVRDAVAAHAESEELTEFGRLRQAADDHRLAQLVAVTAAAPALAAQLPAGSPADVFERARAALERVTTKEMTS
jgi:hypothetical protein